jgi:hypothetical protein
MYIYKFPLVVTDIQTVEMDWDAKILTVQMCDGVPTLWALVRKENGLANKCIRIIGTGHPIQAVDWLDYIGTVQDRGLVWHVFEEHLV